MIKEYFTDGLIGIAILLSLFRTDLVGINNLINYPEVQDIILGQTAAYLPANFHHIHTPVHAFGNPKHLDFDNRAFNIWFQNINHVSLFRGRQEYDIEAFLVSASHQNVPEEQSPNYQEANTFSESNNTQVNSEAEQSTHSFSEEQGSLPVSPVGPSNETSQSNEIITPSVPFLANITPPDCNLGNEDLKLIDILYQQDVDLGVGKEIFDPSFREVLEKERQLEFIKQQEWQKSQLLAEEKEQQKKDKWLKENFRRDGETGEWVQLWNETGEHCGSVALVSSSDACQNDDFMTLEDALDFLGSLGSAQESGNYQNELKTQQFGPGPQQQICFIGQDNSEKVSPDLVDYFSLTANSTLEHLDGTNFILPFSDGMGNPTGLTSDFGLEQNTNVQPDYLIHNTMLTASAMDISIDSDALTPMEELNCSMPLQPHDLNSSVGFDLDDLSLFSNLATLHNSNNDETDMAEIGEFFQSLQNSSCEIFADKTLSESLDAIQKLENLNMSAATTTTSSQLPDFSSSAFDGLEGATGGSNYSSSCCDVTDTFSKLSHLSESSEDSGYAYQGGFSSSPSSSSSSSYAGSPTESYSGISSLTANNDTDYDPHCNGTRVAAYHHVAHNHTYNTPPGQVPREVKKYAQKEPSRKGLQSRDHRRAAELKIPFAIDEIIESSVEVFNELLSAHKLNEEQVTLIRDIRRRGKNKVAAQNCRKRKVSIIFDLNDEMSDLQKMRDHLLVERASMDREKRRLKEKFHHFHTHIFQSLRDERGEPYDPNMYSLQQSSDGSIFLVPLNLPVNIKSNSTSSPSSSKDSISSKKHKPFDY